MPFDWLHPRVGKRPDRRAEVYRQELRERAALLYRLRYPADQARARLTANVRWDYQVGARRPPVDEPEIAAIVDSIYARHGVGAGPLSV